MRNLISRSFFAAILVIIGTLHAHAESNLSANVEFGWNSEYWGSLFGSAQDELHRHAVQGSVTISDKKSGVYGSWWQSLDATAPRRTDNFNFEADYSAGVVKQVGDVSIDTSITYFNIIHCSTDWWDLDQKLQYTRGAWQPTLELAWIVPTNNSKATSGVFGKLGIKGQTLGLSIYPSIGFHSKALGYDAQINFAQLIVTKTIPLSKKNKTLSLVISGLAQTKIGHKPDLATQKCWPPKWSIGINETF